VNKGKIGWLSKPISQSLALGTVILNWPMIFRRRRSKEKPNRITRRAFRYDSVRVSTSSVIFKITWEKPLLKGRWLLVKNFMFPSRIIASRLFDTVSTNTLKHLYIWCTWIMAWRFYVSISAIRVILSTIRPPMFQFLLIIRWGNKKCNKEDDDLKNKRQQVI